MYLLWKYNSFRFLSLGKVKISGRNNKGRIVNYHRGGGTKKKLRLVDNYRFIWNVLGFVLRIEYDPNRNALLALVVYSNGIFSYVVATQGMSVGSRICSGNIIECLAGNTTYLMNIPIGIKISNIELNMNSGSQLIRAAGAYAYIVSKYSNYVLIKLKSGEFRKIYAMNTATIGAVSNFEYIFRVFRKAGYYRLKGWRPVVRGVAKNPVDHPHGGGQGKTSGGRPSVTPKGLITKGRKTRKKVSSMIIKRRK